MEISFIFKVVGVGLIIALLNQILQKSGKEEYTLITTIAGIILAVLMLLPYLNELNEELSAFLNL